MLGKILEIEIEIIFEELLLEIISKWELFIVFLRFDDGDDVLIGFIVGGVVGGVVVIVIGGFVLFFYMCWWMRRFCDNY